MADDGFGLRCIMGGAVVGVIFYYLASLGSFGDLIYIRTILQIISVAGFIACGLGFLIILYNHFPISRIFNNKERP